MLNADGACRADIIRWKQGNRAGNVFGEVHMPTSDFEIKNSGTHDNFVTINDRNKAGTPIVSGWNGKRLNGGSSEFATLELDGNDLAKVRWTAVNVDDQEEARTEDEEAYSGNIIFVSSR